jgi:hypothetical protein
MNDPQLAAFLRQVVAKQKATEQKMAAIVGRYNELVTALQDQPRSITQEIDSIPGRRIFYTLNAVLPFDGSVAGLRATAMSFLVSQDGPFIATHYPMAIWRPSAPETATNFGAWRPVSTWPLPDQVLDTDLIDLSYEIDDTGSQRNFQNEAVAPVLSRPDNMIPLPVPTLFAPNTTIRFVPTFERIVFNTTAEQVATTAGVLWVGFPGYKIVNL